MPSLTSAQIECGRCQSPANVGLKLADADAVFAMKQSYRPGLTSRHFVGMVRRAGSNSST
jgi:hypothetical protein